MSKELLNLPVILSPNESQLETSLGQFVPGALCPYCGQGILDYDGMLNLVCPICGRTECGGCT